MELTPTLILNLVLLIVPPAVLVLVFRQWLSRHIRWTVALTALCDVLLFLDELFCYESFGLFAVLILVKLAATGAADVYKRQFCVRVIPVLDSCNAINRFYCIYKIGI